MTLIELKKSLHKKIDNLNDPDYLQMLDAMISQKNKVFQIPEEHMAGIEQGEKDIINGDYLTMEQLEKRYAEWLKD